MFKEFEKRAQIDNLPSKFIAERYKDLVLHQLRTKKYEDALATANKAFENYSNQLFLKQVLANTYLLNGQFKKAEKIHRANKNVKILCESWKSITLKDFETFRNAGINNENMKKIENILKD